MTRLRLAKVEVSLKRIFIALNIKMERTTIVHSRC